jgi:hypothetical protein
MGRKKRDSAREDEEEGFVAEYVFPELEGRKLRLSFTPKALEQTLLKAAEHIVGRDLIKELSRMKPGEVLHLHFEDGGGEARVERIQ